MVHVRLTAAMVILLAGGAATAFGQTTAKRLYGKWSLGAKRSVVVTEEVVADGRIAASNTEFPRSLEFTSEKKLIIIIGTGEAAETYSGTWKVLDEQPDKLRLEFKIDGEGPEGCKIAIEFLDSDTMRPVFGEREPTMVYRRVRSKPQRH